MTDDEQLRIKLIQDICDKRITGVEAARILRLSSRQVYRLVKRFMMLGSGGLLSLKRGRPSNHRHDERLKLRTLAIIHEYYIDFGPTLAHEKLAEVHDVHISLETLCQQLTSQRSR
nr:helix-turn-helix domain-containing protein [Photobacterium profundum]